MLPDVDLSVIIVTWNVRDLIRACLASLPEALTPATGAISVPAGATHASPLQHEIIVVDNASTDGTAGLLLSDYPGIQLLENSENLGFARANNRALALAKGRYVVLLNADTEPRPGALAGMVRFMDAHARCGAASPRLVCPDGTPQAYAFGRDPSPFYLLRRALAHRRQKYLHDWAISEPVQVDWVSGACLVARREAVAQVGGLDERIFMYFEDNDWCRRMRAAGWEVWYNPAVEVMHIGGASLGRNERARAAYYESLVYFYRKHYGRLPAAILRRLV